MRRLLACLLLFAAAPSAAAGDRRIAITLDDLPFVDRHLDLCGVQAASARLLSALAKHRVPATGFVNEDKIFRTGEVDARIALLQAWLDGGHDLGNHTWGHPGLEATPLETYQEAVVRGEVVTRWLLAGMRRSPRWFRHPFTQTGPDAATRGKFESWLAARGYRTAPFTVELDDFLFDLVYADALRRGDSALAGRVLQSYVEHMGPAMDTFEEMAGEVFGRSIPQILLIHANPLNADAMEQVLAKLEARGYRFVSLDEAIQDPAYSSPDGYVGPRGPSWLLRWSLGLQRSTTRKGQPDPPEWILDLYGPLRDRRKRAATPSR